MYGAGQGFNEGVRTAGGFLFRALQTKRNDERFYDQLALDQAWKDGFYGGPSTLNGGDTPASTIASGQPASQIQSGSPSPKSQIGPPAPYQITRNPSPAELLAGQYKSPWMPDPSTPRTYADPVNPSPARSALPVPSRGSYQTQAMPVSPSVMRTYQGPSPAATPFSEQSPAPHTEQRTFNAPRDPSMVINRMPEVTHTGPSINRIRPDTPLPPISMMRSWFRRGY